MPLSRQHCKELNSLSSILFSMRRSIICCSKDLLAIQTGLQRCLYSRVTGGYCGAAAGVGDGVPMEYVPRAKASKSKAKASTATPVTPPRKKRRSLAPAREEPPRVSMPVPASVDSPMPSKVKEEKPADLLAGLDIVGESETSDLQGEMSKVVAERPRGVTSVAHPSSAAPHSSWALLANALQLEGSAASGSAAPSSRAPTTSITQIVQHTNPEPTSEYQYADHVCQDLEFINELHLMMSILTTVRARMLKIKEQQGK